MDQQFTPEKYLSDFIAFPDDDTIVYLDSLLPVTRLRTLLWEDDEDSCKRYDLGDCYNAHTSDKFYNRCKSLMTPIEYLQGFSDPTTGNDVDMYCCLVLDTEPSSLEYQIYLQTRLAGETHFVPDMISKQMLWDLIVYGKIWKNTDFLDGYVAILVIHDLLKYIFHLISPETRENILAELDCDYSNEAQKIRDLMNRQTKSAIE